MTKYQLDYLYREESRAEVERLIQDYSRTDPLKVIEVDHGVVLPRIPPENKEKYNWMGKGGVVDKNGGYVDLSGIRHINQDAFVFGGKYDLNENDIPYRDEEVVYIGPLFNHWGHFIYEFITRLWYFLEHKQYKLVYCGWGFEPQKLHGAYQRFFELLGIEQNQLVDIRTPIRYRKIIVPEQCYLRRKYYTEKYRELLDTVASHIEVNNLMPSDKVYFSRQTISKTFSGWQREYGESTLIKTLKKNGYLILDPADLSLDEQIYYMKHCETLAVITSSTAADTVFMNPGTNRIYFKKSFYMDDDLAQIDQFTEASDVSVIDCYFEPIKRYKADHPSGPHLIGGTIPVRRFLKENHMISLPDSIYDFGFLRCCIWFGVVVLYRVLFNVTYPIYWHTLRRVIKRKKISFVKVKG